MDRQSDALENKRVMYDYFQVIIICACNIKFISCYSKIEQSYYFG